MSANAIIAFILGIVAHHGLFIHGEWHIQAPTVIVVHIASLFSLFVLQQHSSFTGQLPDALAAVLVSFTTYLFGLFISIGVYRLYFHRLRSFPGPKLAALSKLWHVWKCRDSRNHHVLEDWRQKYGIFVRTGPNEITMFHPAVYEVMDGPKNRNTRSDWYDLLYPRVSSIFTRDKSVHNARRKMWDQALNPTALSHYYSRILNHVGQLERIIEGHGTEPVAMNELMFLFAFDSMGDFGFGEDFGMMRNRKLIDGAFYMRSAISLLGPLSPAIWIPRIAFSFIPGLWKVKHWFKMLDFADSCVDARMKKRSPNIDIVSRFIQDYKNRGSDLVGQRLLSGDTATMLVAGSDTTAPSLVLLLYFLARHPKHAAKIQAELEGVDYRDMRALSALPHLTGTINESIRLLPAVLTFSSRITPPEGLTVDGTFIPGRTKICAPRYSIGRLEIAYEDPHSFIPERWYSKPELVRDKRAFAPFGVGRTSCAGKNLAMAQLRLVAAVLLAKYHIKFAPGTGNREGVEKDMKDQLTATPGELCLVFEKR